MSGKNHGAALAAYRVLFGAAALVASPYIAARALTHAAEMRDRLVLGWPREEGRPIWLHAASVGEVRGLVAVARALAARGPVFATAVTPAGRESLRRALPGVPCRFFPLDMPAAPERALERVRPRTIVVFETELWPGFWSAARARGVPVAVANARLTEKALARYLAFASLWRPLAAGVAFVAAQSHLDAERWVALGAPRSAVAVLGSTKHDVSVDEAGGRRIRAAFEGRRLFVAGSTRPGEEEIVLEAWRRAAPSAEWLLVLAPRHAARFEEVAAHLRRTGATWARWSRPGAGFEDSGILLLDTLGDLNAFFAASEAAFVGGSLLPFGGHNVLEPAAAGVPVLFGPHTQNAGEAPSRLCDAGGGIVVSGADELTVVLARLLAGADERAERGRAALSVASKETGATRRLIDALEKRSLL